MKTVRILCRASLATGDASTEEGTCCALHSRDGQQKCVAVLIHFNETALKKTQTPLFFKKWKFPFVSQYERSETILVLMKLFCEERSHLFSEDISISYG